MDRDRELCTKAPRRRIGVRARQLDGTDGLEERSARERLSQSQCRVGWSPRISRTPPGFELSAPFAFSDTTRMSILTSRPPNPENPRKLRGKLTHLCRAAICRTEWRSDGSSKPTVIRPVCCISASLCTIVQSTFLGPGASSRNAQDIW